MTDNNLLEGLEDWEMTLEHKLEIKKRKREAVESKILEERAKQVFTIGDSPGLPWPSDAYAFLLCHDSKHYDAERYGDWPLFYWIAVRLTNDEEAFEIVRIHTDGRIVERYPGRFEILSYAMLVADTLRLHWNEPERDYQDATLSNDRDLSRNLKLNPWGRAVWERKHPEGPVLAVFQMEPLPLFVAGWLPFAGSRCVPSLVNFLYVTDPARVDAAVDFMAEGAFDVGPSDKMIARAKSIAASYAANGRKGGRPKKGKNAAKPKDTGEDE